MNFGYETETIEFKKTTGELKESMLSIVAMLNKHGYGVLYFGINDNGEVKGQEIGNRTLREISQAIANYIKPQIIPTISLELFEGKNVIKVSVSGTDKPYSAFGKYYIRSADEDRELSPMQLRKFVRDVEAEDEISNLTANSQDLSFISLKTLFTSKGLTVNSKTFEKNLGLINSEGKYNLMAELLADKNDISIKVVTFKGTNKEEMVRRNEYGFKCLAVSMDQVLSYIESINATSVKIGSHQREEQKLFDFACFKEAWQNACIHTKWTKLNPPAVYVFNDRIEIISTGGLPSDLSSEEFYKGISRPINAKLQKIFGQLGYVEQTGHGIPLIMSRYGIQAFDLMNNYLNVIIPFNRQLVVKNNDMPEKDLTSLLPKQLLIYRYIAIHPNATISDMVTDTGISNSYIRKLIKQLKESGYIIRVGSNKYGYWSLSK